MIGIYKITNPLYEVYIGRSSNIKIRILQHKNNSSNEKLKKSIDIHGWENHKVEVICECKPEMLKQKEAFYISEYQRTHTCMNEKPKGRKKIIDRSTIKSSFAISIEQKYLIGQDHDKLREVACLKTAKECFISSIETVLYYQSEIKLQLKVFRANARNINRF